MTGSTSRSARRLWALLAHVFGHRTKRSARVERYLLAAAATIFVAATFWAWQKVPPIEPSSIRFSWLLIAMSLAVLGMVSNALEFALSAHLLGRRLGLGEAVRVSVLGSATSLLPIPGAVLVRTRALRQAGEGTGPAIAVTAGMGIAWVSAAFGAAGALLLWSGGSAALGLLFVGFFVLFSVVFGGLVRIAGGIWTGSVLAGVVGVEVVKVLGSGLRLYAIARTVSVDLSVVEAMTINLGAIVSHAAGVAPGGLGVREVVSGAFAHLAGSEASLGVFVSVLDRVVVYLALGVVVIVVLFLSHRNPIDGPVVESEESP